MLTHFRNMKKAAEIAFEKKDLKLLIQLRLRYPTNSEEFKTVSSYIDKFQ